MAKSEDPLELALASIEKQWGKGAIIRFGSDDRQAVEVISTGSLGLDAALGIGGIPRGRVVEIYGPEASGKTTVALHCVASAQRAGEQAAFIDAEHALDPEYAKRLGVDTDSLLLAQPGTGEEALAITDSLACSGKVAIIVIDSVAALVPRAEIEGDMGDSHVGLQARLMSQALRKITGHLATTGTTCVFINQLREKIGVYFGNPETTTGGKALKFYSSVRLDARAIETLKDGNTAVGKRTRVKVVKNKLSAPFRQAEFDIIWGTGINREGELLDLGVQYGVLAKRGSHYYRGEEPVGNGKEAARAHLTQHPDTAAAVEKDIRALGLPRLQGSQVTASPAASPPVTRSEPDWQPVSDKPV